MKFPTTYDSVISALGPYIAAKRPLDFFVEMYIVDVLELLPAETLAAIQELSTKHPTFFEKHGGDWRGYVVTESDLSQTIKFAIWDLWIRNSETLRQRGDEYDPWDYAKDFHQSYLADDSRVDVWEDGALELTKARIAAYRSPHPG